MKRFSLAVFLMAILGAVAAFAQQRYSVNAVSTPRFEFALGYNYIDANAPPSGCACFGMNGGFLSADYQLRNWLGVTGKFTANHASNISDLGQGLTLMTFLGGPRVSLPYRRITPYAEVLFGGAHASDSYFPSETTGSTTSATSFALSAGGGVDFHLTDLLAIRLIDAQYLRTGFPNGADDLQHHLQLGAGIVFKFDGLGWHHKAALPPPPHPEVALACSVNTAEVTAGDLVQVVGEAVTLPADKSVAFTWTTTGGQMQQAGHILTINTAGLAPGSYSVVGHASLTSDPSVAKDCTARFQVKQPAPPQNPVASAPKGITQKEFREHVKDAFFDYDEYDLRPDAKETLNQDLLYLKAHPELQITIGGYADERGSAEFNLSLGLNRAKAAREALIDGGIDPSRIMIISYGKSKQFCTEEVETCYQSNRRAQIMLRTDQ